MKLLLLFFSGILLLELCGCSDSPNASSLSTDISVISRDPVPGDFSGGILISLPVYDDNSSQMWQVDLRSKDLSKLDLGLRLYDLLYADFNTKTIWPSNENLPMAFNTDLILDLGKNPGLGIRELHRRGITGEGIGIGIIDQPILTRHCEIVRSLRLYEELEMKSNSPASMHGAAVSSIAIGKHVGVAPDASLYYIATTLGDHTSSGFDFTNYAKSIRRLLSLNKDLPVTRKIKVIAMQIGWSPGDVGFDDIMAACEEAKSEGVFVISSSLEAVYGFKFHGLGRFPMADPDNFNSYEPGIFYSHSYYAGGTFSDRLLIPMDSRTTASETGNNDYVFYREGGWSWSIPFIAAMYALAVQVDSSITPQKFWVTAMKTGRTITMHTDKRDMILGPIIDPVALVNELTLKK